MAKGEAPRLLKSVLAPTSYGLSTSESLTRPPLARGNMVFLEVDRRMPCRMNHEPLVDATRWNHTPKKSIFRHVLVASSAFGRIFARCLQPSDLVASTGPILEYLVKFVMQRILTQSKGLSQEGRRIHHFCQTVC